MGAEQGEKSDKQDPVIDSAEAALKRIDAHEDDRLDSLESKQKELLAQKAKLESEKASALDPKNGSKGTARALQLDKVIAQLDKRIQTFEGKKEKAVKTADTKEARQLKRIETKAVNLEKKATESLAKDPEAAARAEELASLKIEETQLLESYKNAPPDATPEAKTAMLAKLETVQKQIEKLEAQDKTSEMLDHAKELRAAREKMVQREDVEHREEARAADESLKSLDPASGTVETKEPEKKGLFGGMAETTKNIILKYANTTRDPTDVSGNMKFTIDKVWAQITYAMSPKEITWNKDLTENQVTMLSDAGITFESGKTEGTSIIKFGKPSEDYGVSPKVESVMKENFGDNWYLKFKNLNTTDTIADLKKGLPDNPQSDEDKAMVKFVTDVEAKMKADGAEADTPVLKWLEENGDELKKEEPIAEKTVSPTEAEDKKESSEPKLLKLTDDAAAVADQWELTILSKGIIGPMGEPLLELQDGQTADLKKENEGLTLVVHKAGEPDHIFPAKTYEEFAKQLTPEPTATANS